MNDGSGIKEKNNMGVVYELACGEGGGFRKKKRRTVNPNGKEKSYMRSLARFRQIPAFEYQDSE